MAGGEDKVHTNTHDSRIWGTTHWAPRASQLGVTCVADDELTRPFLTCEFRLPFCGIRPRILPPSLRLPALLTELDSRCSGCMALISCGAASSLATSDWPHLSLSPLSVASFDEEQLLIFT